MSPAHEKPVQLTIMQARKRNLVVAAESAEEGNFTV